MRNKFEMVGYASLGLLGLTGMALIFPIVGAGTQALETDGAAYAETRVAVSAAPAVSVNLGQSVDVDVTPTSTGSFGYSSTTLKIYTNNEEGYKIFLATADGDGALKNTNIEKTGEGYQINALAGVAAGKNDFPTNTWGYVLSDTAVTENSTYSPVPTSSANSILNVVNASATGEDVYNLGFGTKIGSNLAAGEYSNSVIVSVVANPQTISTFSQLTYMQDMKPEYCNNAAVNTTKQLIDTRDGKRYWVAKLADGNCWMTQNLALDLNTGRTLTTNDSDVTANWTPTRNTETEIPALTSDDNKQARSWNLGEIVLTNPTGSSLCPQATTPSGYNRTPDQYDSAFVGQSIVENCQWYKDVTGMTSGYKADATSSINPNKMSYDAHYLIGNYYQWGAVTAGTGIATDSGNTTDGKTDKTKLKDATGSICPKGWKLPTDGAYEVTNLAYPYEREDSFYNLLRAYGYPATGSSVADSNQSVTQWITNNGNPYTSIVGGSKVRLDYAPMYFVRSGYVAPTTGSLRSAGDSGFYWSSTAYPGSATVAYDLYFYTTNVVPADRSTRYFGFSARCVAR